jgi:hypothetical protein
MRLKTGLVVVASQVVSHMTTRRFVVYRELPQHLWLPDEREPLERVFEFSRHENARRGVVASRKGTRYNSCLLRSEEAVRAYMDLGGGMIFPDDPDYDEQEETNSACRSRYCRLQYLVYEGREDYPLRINGDEFEGYRRMADGDLGCLNTRKDCNRNEKRLAHLIWILLE